MPNTELGHLFLSSKSGKARHAEGWASARVREEKELSYEEWGGRVSRYLSHLEMLFSPTLFVLGGGVSKKADKWLPYVQLERSRAVPAALANDAGIVGAALYAETQLGQPKAPRPALKAQPVAASATRGAGKKKVADKAPKKK